MLRLRLAIEENRANDLATALEGTGGVHQIVSMSREPTGAGVVLEADLLPAVADQVMGLIREWEIADGSYLITRQEVIAPTPVHGPITSGNEFAWIEVIGEARANARLLGRYLALMSVAGVLGALGVITDNPILVVGAMAVSPDLLPICAACVGIVARRARLAATGACERCCSASCSPGRLRRLSPGAAAGFRDPHRRLPGPRQLPPRPRAARLLDDPGCAGGGRGGDALVRDQGGEPRSELRSP